ncbi:MAG: hypothetical protein OHM77_09410 [Candidatus Nitricoxidivorans perseverans]|uniref:Uncharacterized protein n=1 Tax=Candidatus Nitricoxidivorans perseverans TaxID=2975601 RepID=A0AA49FJT3_9PROT|nr:MAG: hypothetical protein OHM77_09410 [Candidatus Nitricoxidivorans perseverans]
MRNSLIAIMLAVSPSIALAQMTVGVQRSSSPRGVQIQGDTDIKASAQNVNAIAVGDDNAAANAAGAVKGDINIKGNTRINATVREANAIAVGKGNKADNTVGTVGGK